MTRVSYRISGTIGGAAQEDVKDTFTEGLVAPDARIVRARPSSRNASFIERKVSYFETHTSTWRRAKSPEWHATNSARANLVKDHKSFNTMRWSLFQPLQSIASYVPIAVSYFGNSRYISHSHELGTPIVPNSANLCVACLRNTWVQDLRSPISSSPAIALISPKAFQNKVSIDILCRIHIFTCPIDQLRLLTAATASVSYLHLAYGRSHSLNHLNFYQYVSRSWKVSTKFGSRMPGSSGRSHIQSGWGWQ